MKLEQAIVPPGSGDEGFALLETLVALLVLTISLGMLLQSLAAATQQLKMASQITSAEFMALSALSAIGQDRSTNGSSDGLIWNRETTNRQLSKGSVRYQLKRVVIPAGSGEGRSYSLSQGALR